MRFGLFRLHAPQTAKMIARQKIFAQNDCPQKDGSDAVFANEEDICYV